MCLKIITPIIILFLFPLITYAQLELDFYDLFFESIEQTSNLSIDSYELIWSTDTYTPYNYQGRALPSQGSKVFVQAITNISQGSASDFKYSWFLDDVFQNSKSGYGKENFDFYTTRRSGTYHTIKLQIFNENRTIFEEKSIEIPLAEPEITIISSLDLNKNYTFNVRPYFFSIEKLTDLIFEWNIPGQEPIISSEYNASILNLNIQNKETSEIIQKDFLINVKNKKIPYQNASQIIKVNL